MKPSDLSGDNFLTFRFLWVACTVETTQDDGKESQPSVPNGPARLLWTSRCVRDLDSLTAPRQAVDGIGIGPGLLCAETAADLHVARGPHEAIHHLNL